MKSVSTALAALINIAGGQAPLPQWDLYAIYPRGGGALLYTTADFSIFAADNTIWDAPKLDASGNLWTSGITWVPKVIDIEGSKATASFGVGLNADTWTVTLVPRLLDIVTGAAFPDQIGSTPFLEAARSGALDGADIIVSRAYFSTVPAQPIPVAGLSPVGTLLMFRGFVTDVQCSISEAVIRATDYRALLDQDVPSIVYQAGCRHTLFDSRCSLSKGSYTSTGTALDGSTPANIKASVAAPAGSGTFVLGTLTMTSGANSGLSRTVFGWDGTNFQLLTPFPSPVATGDTFSVTAGCNKSAAACALFSNTANFGGEPYIPIPEVSIG